MNVGKKIKKHRLELNLSQEQLGHSLNPPVNRAAINKWETGQVKNIKRKYIYQLARKFGVTPTELLCFDEKFGSDHISKEVKLIEQIQKHFGKDAVELLNYFILLNDVGKQKALDDIADLTEIPKYV